jgi:hypothetical protein
LQTPPEVPQNGEFMIAAYVLVAVVLAVYSVSLFLRAGRMEREVGEG